MQRLVGPLATGTIKPMAPRSSIRRNLIAAGCILTLIVWAFAAQHLESALHYVGANRHFHLHRGRLLIERFDGSAEQCRAFVHGRFGRPGWKKFIPQNPCGGCLSNSVLAALLEGWGFVWP